MNSSQMHKKDPCHSCSGSTASFKSVKSSLAGHHSPRNSSGDEDDKDDYASADSAEEQDSKHHQDQLEPKKAANENRQLLPDPSDENSPENRHYQETLRRFQDPKSILYVVILNSLFSLPYR